MVEEPIERRGVLKRAPTGRGVLKKDCARAAAGGPKWDQAKWDQTKWDQAKWDQAKWDQAKWDQAKWDQAKWDQSKWDQASGTMLSGTRLSGTALERLREDLRPLDFPVGEAQHDVRRLARSGAVPAADRPSKRKPGPALSAAPEPHC